MDLFSGSETSVEGTEHLPRQSLPDPCPRAPSFEVSCLCWNALTPTRCLDTAGGLLAGVSQGAGWEAFDVRDHASGSARVARRERSSTDGRPQHSRQRLILRCLSKSWVRLYPRARQFPSSHRSVVGTLSGCFEMAAGEADRKEGEKARGLRSLNVEFERTSRF